MEVEEEKLRSPQDDKSAKRRMKTPLQRETLEKVFAEEKYPSEAVRAELSVQLGLSDRQLKLWFCHRRLKDRKSKEDDDPAVVAKKPQQKEKASSLSEFPASEAMDFASMKPKFSDEEERKGGSGSYLHDEALSRSKKPMEKRVKDPNGAPRKRSRHAGAKSADPSRDAEVRAISSVEAQLGEPLRQDGPALGLEFDPLPSGAFGSPAVSLQHHRPPVACESQSHMGNKAFERSTQRFELKPHKNLIFNQTSHKGGRRRKTVDVGQSLHTQPGSRALQEYQFIPEQPSGRGEIGPAAYERTAHGKLLLGSENPLQALTSHGSFLRNSESLANSFGLQGRFPNVEGGLMFHVDGHNNHLFPHSGGGFEGLHRDSLSSFGYDSHFGGHNSSFQLLPMGASMGRSEKLSLLNEHDPARMGRKRKSEEARIVKEIEAHKKRIRREIERQEIARRKREELLRKELEKHDREKRKEVERMVREKQREDERMKREQRREYERREKLIQKETERLERQRQKEEIRRLKEATKLKAAIERATARRLARESIELIDDERLELLEAAAISQGLPSIYLLDGETLQGLDRYKDRLKKFPPLDVRMKKPLAGSPWIDAQQNVGNLFMVWRFLTTFADVLGLWPFTIDEFVQAFHDYDPRLLGEIHVALLKLLVKDIEDVAQASASGAVVNQYTPAYTGGGHSQLVEAAFAWGFDIREWGQHLNPLTWPEVLRQFALAAGYGPRWKKQLVEMDDFRYDDEGNQGEEAVIALRSGAAAANAVTLMKMKGGFHVRRCRYRLTPGTVKYAAFHVLSVEGENGLSILEVVDRIQKSGLRDLTTSKTPEASIAAALSRDTKFFERVAPSTYCVRPAFRKDPEDAERLLQAARERVRLFQSGISEADDAEKDTEDADEAEREDDSDDDVDDVEGDDIQGVLDEGKGVFCLKEGRVIEPGENYEKVERLQLQDSNTSSQLRNIDGGQSVLISSVVNVNKSADVEIEGSMQQDELLEGLATSTDTEIDESHAGEPWVQGLMEGEYSDLSVEERLSALVALVEAVNEGNTVRAALEERMEAANALKRQMWAEAQLDKRRLKEEQLLKSQSHSGEGLKIEGPIPNIEESPTVEDGKIVEDEKALVETMAAEPATSVQNDLGNAPPLEKGLGVPGCINQDASITTVSGFALDKTRAQLKVDIGLRAEELYVYRSLPLGFDRRHNRYWQFVTCNAGEDPGCGRLYFESSEDGHWEVINTEEAFNALMTNLDTRGIREAHLHGILQKLESSIKQGMRKSGSNAGLQRRLPGNDGDSKTVHLVTSRSPMIELAVSYHTGYISEEGSSGDGAVLPGSGLYGDVGAIPIQLGNTMAERQRVLESYMEFDKWLWSKQTPEISGLIATELGKKRSLDLIARCEVCREFYWVRDRHCPCCHATLDGFPKLEAKFSQHVHECEEKRRREDASWKLHGSFRSLPSRVQLLKAQIVAVEAAITVEALKPAWTEAHRKAWAAKLKHASSPGELLQILTELEGAVLRDWLSPCYETTEELLEAASLVKPAGPAVLPWLPQTTAAVALRLLAFDTALFYSVEQKQQSLNQPDQNHSKAGAVPIGKIKNSDTYELSPPIEEEKLDSWIDVGNGQAFGRGRGRGGRPRGRGCSRGGGSGATRNITATGGVRKVSKRLHFSGDVHDAQAIKSGRGRGCGQGGRAFSLEKTIRGRGRGSRSGRRRHSRIQETKEDWDGNTYLTGPGLTGMYENATEQEILSDRAGSENEDWEAQEYSDEQCNNRQSCDSENEEDAVMGAEEVDDAEQEELIVEDEYEEEEDEEEDGQYEELGHVRQGSVMYSEDDEAESVEAAEDEDEDEDEDEYVNKDENDIDGVDDGDSHGISDDDGGANDHGGEEREDESFDSQSFDESD